MMVHKRLALLATVLSVVLAMPAIGQRAARPTPTPAPTPATSTQDRVTAVETFGVHALPAADELRLGRVSVRRLRRAGFTKGVAVHKSEHGAIWIVAQAGVRDIAVARARNLLEFYLKPRPGAGRGEVAQKQAVIAKMNREQCDADDADWCARGRARATHSGAATV